MRAATVVSSVWRAYALAFGLGLAILGMGAGLAHAQSTATSAPTQITQPQVAAGLLPAAPDNSFVCHAKTGGWCDLRDWRGFGETMVN
ncbi:MAG TPA: hypothetical protein VGF92_17140 [Stellaceae bacterium]|jgi:hypothetical protein